ncbi:MAG: DUF6198 family protein [Defluviitaleaceae bacterium]|nr:DUF6198 family protein [Defluviitaleaceae bacterium]
MTNIDIKKFVSMVREKRLIERILIYNAGLFIWALGVAFAINAELGISPIQLVPFVASEILGIDMGICVTILFLTFILLQIIIMRKEFKWINLTQIIFSFVFGYFVSAARLIVGDFRIPTYAGQLLMLGIGIVLISSGVVFYMQAKLVNLSSEGLVEAIVYKIEGSAFHRIKVLFDSALVVIGIVISLAFFGELHGVREGTLISAILIGKFMPFARKGIEWLYRFAKGALANKGDM